MALDHSLAIKTDGTLWAWGLDVSGQHGDGTFSPVRIGNDTNWASVSAGLVHSLAIKTNGELWAWRAINGIPVRIGGN
jgi:alpha-tubulin suppressor-like RCC1 family protein